MFFGATGIIQGVSAWRTSGSPIRWTINNPPSIQRIPEDIFAQTNYPIPPKPNGGNGTIGSSSIQDSDLKTWVYQIKKLGGSDIRVNQEQVNAEGLHVGINKPDLQYTLNNERFYVEWDTPNSTRGIPHAQRIYSNDPFARNILNLTFPYTLPKIQYLQDHIILIEAP